MIDLCDVHDVGARLAAGKCFGYPCEGKVDVAVGQLRLRHDLDAALDNGDIETLIGIETLVDRCVVAGELRLREPLQLQTHRFGRRAFCRRCRFFGSGRLLGSSRLFGGRGFGSRFVAAARGPDKSQHRDACCE